MKSAVLADWFRALEQRVDSERGAEAEERAAFAARELLASEGDTAIGVLSQAEEDCLLLKGLPRRLAHWFRRAF